MQFHKVPTNVQEKKKIVFKKIMDIQQSFLFYFFKANLWFKQNCPNLTKGYSQTLEREWEREISPHF